MPISRLETLNDQAVSWSEIQIVFSVPNVAILTMVDIKSIKHESKVDIGEQRGATGGRVVKRTTGAVTNTASAVLFSEGSTVLEEALATAAEAAGAINGNGSIQLSVVRFNVYIAHSFANIAAPISRRELINCRYLRDSEDDEDGTDAKEVEIDLNPTSIIKVLPSGRRVELL